MQGRDELKGKVCLVTGATSGVGRSIAAGCARAGATVVIVSRDQRRGEEAVRSLQEASGNPAIELIAADMAEMSSVRILASAVRRRHRQLHVLSLNAATLCLRRETTSAGHERTFATNYLGHFLLTNLLLDALREGAPARVLAVSGHPSTLLPVRLDMADLMLEKGYSALRATGQAALAKALFMLELSRRVAGTGVSANTFHPGIVRSGLPSHLPLVLRLPARLAMAFASGESATGVWLATSPDALSMSGKFFVRRRPVPFAPRYDRAEVQAALWEASARLVGIPAAGPL